VASKNFKYLLVDDIYNSNKSSLDIHDEYAILRVGIDEDEIESIEKDLL
jgi:hypothetical protein